MSIYVKGMKRKSSDSTSTFDEIMKSSVQKKPIGTSAVLVPPHVDAAIQMYDSAKYESIPLHEFLNKMCGQDSDIMFSTVVDIISEDILYLANFVNLRALSTLSLDAVISNSLVGDEYAALSEKIGAINAMPCYVRIID